MLNFYDRLVLISNVSFVIFYNRSQQKINNKKFLFVKENFNFLVVEESVGC